MTFSACGTSIEYITSSTNLIGNQPNFVRSIGLDTNSSSSTYGKVVVKVEVGYLMNETSVFIHARNIFGVYASPVELKVTVIYNCEFDSLIVNNVTLNQTMLSNMPNGLTLNYLSRMFTYEAEFENTTIFTLDLSYFITNNASVYCPIT